MAIKNFIKTGTYTRIKELQWQEGIVVAIVVDTFATKPSKSYKYVEDFDDTKNESLPENMRIKGSRVVEDDTAPIHSSRFDVIADSMDVDKYNTYFKNSVWSASSQNLHKKCYEYLLSLDVFSEASKDQ